MNTGETKKKYHVPVIAVLISIFLIGWLTSHMLKDARASEKSKTSQETVVPAKF